MKNENRASIASLIGALILMGAAVFYVFFLQGVLDGNDVKAAELKSVESEYQSLKARLKEVEDAGEDFDLSSEVQIKEATAKVPAEVNQDEVIRSVVEMAEENRIDLSAISFSQGVSGAEGVGSLRVNASFQGDYRDLINFLESIEQNKRLFVVNSINVSVTTLDVTGLEVANFSLSLETFYLM